jgi:hypothetical protein
MKLRDSSGKDFAARLGVAGTQPDTQELAYGD